MYFGLKIQRFAPVATYLGLKIDRNFNFKKMILARFKAAKSQSYRLFNHSSRKTGSNPRTLLNIFQTYVLSVLQYSASIWIFRVRSFTTNGATSNTGYITIWNEVEKFYFKCLKCALGLQSSTSNIATLVIAKQWPLDYRLAYQAAIWYYKIHSNMSGTALQKQYLRLRQSSNFNSTLFYAPASSFIKTMSQPEEDLLSISTLIEFKSSLRIRVQEKLDQLWKVEPKGVWTRQLLPDWKSEPLTSKMHSKPGSVRQLQMISGHFQCNEFRHRTNQAISPNCRHGCDCIEDIAHILLYCPHYSTQRAPVLSTLATYELQPTVKNMLTHEKTTLATQKFLASISIGG